MSRGDRATHIFFAAAAVTGFGTVLNRIKAQRRLSLIYDRWQEIAQHERLAGMTGLKVYFAYPHSPWQRIINEITNGLLRQYFPNEKTSPVSLKSS